MIKKIVNLEGWSEHERGKKGKFYNYILIKYFNKHHKFQMALLLLLIDLWIVKSYSKNITLKGNTITHC